jgi:hypothetical protein
MRNRESDSKVETQSTLSRQPAGQQQGQVEHPLLQLQRQYGNRYVQRLVAQAREGEEGASASPDVEQAIQQARGGGQALDSGVRAQMEPAFGADFGGVRVHTDVRADALNRSLNARAFTTDQDIFFRQGAYSPGSSSGRKLVAHELTHVVQQNGDQVRRKLTVGQPGDRYEQEADQMAQAVMQQEQQTVRKDTDEGLVRRQVEEEDESVQTRAEGPRVQRQAEEEEEGPVQPKAKDGWAQEWTKKGKEFTQVKPLAGLIRPLIQKKAAEENDEEFLQTKQGSSQTLIQRDLATPPPATPAPAQPNLTAGEVTTAINFNRRRYNAAGTRLIQDLVGTTPTGTWVEADIRAIAAIQEEYGLRKDGRVGTRTFRFLDTEVRNERLRRTDAHCLTALVITRGAQNIVPRANGATMTRNFSMRAQFPRYCNCGNYEYRQFIRGHLRVERGGVVRDEGAAFSTLPAGRLNTGWQEDGDTTAAALNYGHRTQPAESGNRYLDDTGAVDMANGCRYEGRDTPGGNYTGTPGFTPTTGDIIDINVNFRGEIQRNGRPVHRRWWSALRRRFTLP